MRPRRPPFWAPVSGASLSLSRQGCADLQSFENMQRKRPSADIGPTLFGPFFSCRIGSCNQARIGSSLKPLQWVASVIRILDPHVIAHLEINHDDRAPVGADSCPPTPTRLALCSRNLAY